jgi:uncharacterized protein (UPF0261 family)
MTHAPHHLRAGLRSDRGSMGVELVAVIPLLVLVTIVCVQAFAIVSAMEATQRAARDGARAAAMGQDGPAAARRALPHWVHIESVTVGSGGGCGGDVCSDVVVKVPIGFPGIMTADLVTVQRSAAMPRTS